MKIVELLEEIEEIADTSTRIPLNGKIAVSKDELLEIIKDIKIALPDEIQQAMFIKNERQRILDEAKREYELIINDAEKQSEVLIEKHEITTQSKQRASMLIKTAEDSARALKLESFEYIDQILFDFQEKTELFNTQYIGGMFNNLQKSFNDIRHKLIEDRNEISELSSQVQKEPDCLDV